MVLCIPDLLIIFIHSALVYFVGNKAKGQISKRRQQENKTGQIFRK